jgi:hypothetical protein
MSTKLANTVTETAAARAAPAPLARRATPLAPASETQVFVAEDGRRAQLLRALGAVAAVLMAIWLVALIAGAFGLGRLPAVPLPHVGALREAPAAAERQAPRRGPASSTSTPAPASSGDATPGAIAPSLSPVPSERRANARSRTHGSPRTTAPGQTGAAPTPSGITPPNGARGKSKDRTSSHTPPGQSVPRGERGRSVAAPGHTRSSTDVAPKPKKKP